MVFILPLLPAVQNNGRKHTFAKQFNSATNGAGEMRIGSFDGGVDGELTSFRLVEISKIFVCNKFSMEQYHLTEFGWLMHRRIMLAYLAMLFIFQLKHTACCVCLLKYEQESQIS